MIPWIVKVALTWVFEWYLIELNLLAVAREFRHAKWVLEVVESHSMVTVVRQIGKLLHGDSPTRKERDRAYWIIWVVLVRLSVPLCGLASVWIKKLIVVVVVVLVQGYLDRVY